MLPSLPSPSDTRLAIKLHPRAERAVKRGHPWVFAQGIKEQRREGRAGDLAVLFDRNNAFLAVGLYDPTSPIRVRVLHSGTPLTIDREWFAGRVASAAERRLPLLDQETTGYRVVHGENDQLPGLVADRYGESIVVKLYTAAWLPHLPQVLESLIEAVPARRVVLRLSRALQREEDQLHGLFDGQTVYGSPPEAPEIFQENGLHFEADLIKGQKTGFFLDQRDNRARVEKLSAGRSVLNVFAYTGGFSLYAARGGADRITSLDISSPALAAAARNFEHNEYLDVDPGRHHVLRADAFDALQALTRQKELFDLVVLDPPAFAKSRDEVDLALRTYRRLTRLGVGVLAPGGILVAASCSSRVGADDFSQAVEDAAEAAGRRLSIIERTGHAMDHPISFPEAAYLKCIFATVA